MFEQFFTASFWDYSVLSNTLRDYVIGTLLFLVLFLVFRIFNNAVLGRFRKAAEATKNTIDDLAVSVIESLKPPFYALLALYLALKAIYIAPIFEKIISAALIVWVVYQAVIAAEIVLFHFIKSRFPDEAGAKSAGSLLTFIIRLVMWSVGALLVLSNIGVNITSLIAGLGIGGVAIALALQNILGDLFSAFAIHLDKPFVVGDFIIVGDKLGVVKKIGIKTTRIQALQGEELILTNKELTSAPIQNFKQMHKRRVPFTFGVVYETTIEGLKKIPSGIKEIISSMQSVDFDRAHFKGFGESSLDFEIVYYLNSADYNIYMDTQQEINLKIMEFFKREKIVFAYPTRTLYTINSKKPQ
ncbi:MAG: mechanosensitive ion channel family protein [bacterium]|nr:mechanosensitive ion channel family protein [bacterium]